MSLTYESLKNHIGKDCLVSFEKINVLCKITNASVRWGKVDVLVEPIGGEGQQWVSESRLVME